MVKRVFCFIICIFMPLSVSALAEPSPMPVADSFTEHVFVNDGLDGFELPYRLFVPKEYDSQKEYPVILFLHGVGERGNDNSAQLQPCVQNLFDTCPELLNECIFILPQCPVDQQWAGRDFDFFGNGNYSTADEPETEAMQTAIRLLESILDEYSCDRNRVYIMGLSMGGFGTWDALVRHGELFAAAVPMCGGGDEAYAGQLADIPIWAYHGTADPVVQFEGSQRMFDAIVAAGGDKIIFTAVEGAGHDVWTEATSNAELIRWLFSQSSSEAAPVSTEALPEASPVPTAVPDSDGGISLPPAKFFAVFGFVALAIIAVAVFTEKKK